VASDDWARQNGIALRTYQIGAERDAVDYIGADAEGLFDGAGLRVANNVSQKVLEVNHPGCACIAQTCHFSPRVEAPPPGW